MADYWKSQDRKYCDFCKCWITDNRPSVDFHEKGRRHQENVKKKLRTITKNSERAHKESEKLDGVLKQMEAAAMEAYRKDVDNNADLTSQAINKKLKEENLTIHSTGSDKPWHEMKSSDEKTYFWNTVSGETSWEPPPEGYVSLVEQKETEFKNQLKTAEKMRQKEEALSVQTREKEEMEERARQAREKLKERRVVDEIKPVEYGPILEPGPLDPYGKWQTVEKKPDIDLQLPKQEYEQFELHQDIEPEPVVREFKEKTVGNLNVGGETTFKKRKFAGTSRKNTRQRLDND